MTKYYQAPQSVVEMVLDVRTKYHPSLIEAEIGIIFRDKPSTSKGKTVFATAKKPPTWLRAYPKFENMDFIIEIAEETWRDLTTNQRIALIDHELCHCQYDSEEETASMQAHDIEEFRAVINRHGFWNADLLKSAPVLKEAIQMEFGDFREAKIDGKVVTISPEEMIPDTTEETISA